MSLNIKIFQNLHNHCSFNGITYFLYTTPMYSQGTHTHNRNNKRFPENSSLCSNFRALFTIYYLIFSGYLYRDSVGKLFECAISSLDTWHLSAVYFCSTLRILRALGFAVVMGFCLLYSDIKMQRTFGSGLTS